jgi:hypothetical protein
MDRAFLCLQYRDYGLALAKIRTIDAYAYANLATITIISLQYIHKVKFNYYANEWRLKNSGWNHEIQ